MPRKNIQGRPGPTPRKQRRQNPLWKSPRPRKQRRQNPLWKSPRHWNPGPNQNRRERRPRKIPERRLGTRGEKRRRERRRKRQPGGRDRRKKTPRHTKLTTK
ncbi:hypothetical protein BDZ91DRAFT_731527 [Kalaharituber pfeilii]|nr:hypothetical protein BDZ91DRAFT_731527 [Kalaharituber pfeilii]